jgi:hypothetical protein
MATKPDQASAAEPLWCARCTTALQPGSGNFFQVTIEAVADPTPPNVSAEDPARLRENIEQLIRQMGDLSAQEALDQVYRRLTIYLCGPCFRQWIENPAA